VARRRHSRTGILRCSRMARVLPAAVRSSLLLVLGPAEQLTPEAQSSIPQFEIARMRNGALQGVDQLGDGGEDRAVIVDQLAGSGLCEATLDDGPALLHELGGARLHPRRTAEDARLDCPASDFGGSKRSGQILRPYCASRSTAASQRSGSSSYSAGSIFCAVKTGCIPNSTGIYFLLAQIRYLAGVANPAAPAMISHIG
jgi:hypothetical protein